MRSTITILGNVLTLFLVMALSATILWAIVYVFVPDPCNLYVLQMASESMKNVVFSCEEFWINRYQSLIGSVLTGTVAFLTIRLIIGQLNAANQQANVAGAQGLKLKRDELLNEVGKIDQIFERCGAIMQMCHDIDQHISKYAFNEGSVTPVAQRAEIAANAFRAIVVMAADLRAEDPGSERSRLYGQISDTCNQPLIELAIWRPDRAQVAVTKEAVSKGLVEASTVRTLLQTMNEAKSKIIAMGSQAKKSAQEDLPRIMKRMREFEARATAEPWP